MKSRFLLTCLLLLVFAAPASAQVVFGGIFRQSNEPRAAWIGSEWPDFVKKWGDIEKQGQRMFQFKTSLNIPCARYPIVWKGGTPQFP